MKVCSKCKVEKPKAEFSKNASKKGGLSSECKKCKSAVDAARYSKNFEKTNANCALYRAANAEKIKASKQAWENANIKKVRAYKADYHLKNKEIIRAAKATYRANNLEKVLLAERLRCASYRAAHPDKCADLSRNRRARERSAEGTHTAADVRTIFEAQRGLCANCQTKLFKSGKQKYHVDHIMPLALGGSNWPSNLQCLCPACILSKGAKHPDDWAREQGRLI